MGHQEEQVGSFFALSVSSTSGLGLCTLSKHRSMTCRDSAGVSSAGVQHLPPWRKMGPFLPRACFVSGEMELPPACLQGKVGGSIHPEGCISGQAACQPAPKERSLLPSRLERRWLYNGLCSVMRVPLPSFPPPPPPPPPSCQLCSFSGVGAGT